MTTPFLLDARTVTPHFPGIGRYVSNLAHAIVPELGVNEKLLLLVNPKVPEQCDRLPKPGGQRVDWVKTDSTPFSLEQQWKLPSLIRKSGASIYHSPYYMMPYFVSKPTITTIYDFIPELYPELVAPRARRLTRWATRRAIRSSADLICISQATREDLVNRYSVKDEPRVIHLAPDPVFTPAEPAVVSELKTRLNLPELFVLYVAINKPHKNLVRLIEAWAEVKTDASLVIGGRWDDRYPEPKQAADRLQLGDRVRFIGPVEEYDMRALYSAAELFVFPSLYEGFGLPVIESMACGTPVACSYSSSLPEVGGLAAMYFDPLDVQDMAQTLTATLADKKRLERMRQKSLNQAQQFTWRSVAKQTLTLYRSLS